MSTWGNKRKLDTSGEVDLDSSIGELGVSRTGRVRKKSSRLLQLEEESSQDTTRDILHQTDISPDNKKTKAQSDHVNTSPDGATEPDCRYKAEISPGGSSVIKLLLDKSNSGPDATATTSDIQTISNEQADTNQAVAELSKTAKRKQRKRKLETTLTEKPFSEPYKAIQEDGLKLKLILSPKESSKKKDWDSLMNSATENQLQEFKKSKKRKKHEPKDKNEAKDRKKDKSVKPATIKEEVIDDKPSVNQSDDVGDELKLNISEVYSVKPDPDAQSQQVVSYADFISSIHHEASTSPEKAKKPRKKKVKTQSSKTKDIEANVASKSLLKEKLEEKLPAHQPIIQKLDKEKEKERKRTEKKEMAAKKKMEKVRKRPPTAYTIWTASYRHKILAQNPQLDFASVSKRLGEIWHGLPEKEKTNWKRKAKKMANNKAPWKSYFGGYATNSSNFVTPKGVTLTKASSRKVITPAQTQRGLQSIKSNNGMTEVDPVDAAAHLKLLGESLSLLGVRLQEHKGPIAVQGSMSVLLDSMICALGPLLALTNQIPELNGCTNEVCTNILDDIAFIMPGL